MRVLVNAISAWDSARTGVGHHTSELIQALHRIGAADAIQLYPPPWLGRTVAAWKHCRTWWPQRPQPSVAEAPSDAILEPPSQRRPSSPSLKHRLLQHHFRRFCAGGSHDLYHEPNFIPFDCDLPTVATIHDLSVLLHPEWHPVQRVRDYERRFHAGLARCTHFLAVSEFTRREVMTVLGIPPERITRTYNGVRCAMRPLPAAAVQAVLRRLRLPPRYLLHVGTIEPRKNLLMLLHAYAALPAALRDSCPLVLVGGWGWHHEEIRGFLKSEGSRLGVLHVGYLAEADLPAVYNGALALLLPSHYEGFGLPALEMLACGGAVLASTAEALVELVSGQAHLINACDPLGWREAMQRVITDTEWRNSLRQGAVQRAARFTWEAFATDTLRVYRRLTAAGTRPLERLAEAG
jgi:alpha-1,3-rhamnosyl/mannosyltransferase